MEPQIIELFKYGGVTSIVAWAAWQLLIWVGNNIIKPVVSGITEYLAAATKCVQEQTTKLQSVESKVDHLTEKVGEVREVQDKHMDFCRPQHTAGYPGDLPPREEKFSRPKTA